MKHLQNGTHSGRCSINFCDSAWFHICDAVRQNRAESMRFFCKGLELIDGVEEVPDFSA
jgi:hypothetical protein